MHKCKWRKGGRKIEERKKEEREGKRQGVRRQREWERPGRKRRKMHVCFKEG